MPELPDLTVYIESLERRLLGAELRRVDIRSPFLLRTVEPAPSAAEGHVVGELRRIGKRVAIGFDEDLWFVFHLMIAGRFQWSAASRPTGRRALARFEFETGMLTLTEAGTKRRASLHVVRGRENLHDHDPGGIEVLDSTADAFAEAITRESHTLKRALTDPRLLAGIGNAYSDEILHRSRLSPLALTQKLTRQEIARLHEATISVLTEWTRRLRVEAGEDFPAKVTAFRDGMSVHGRYGQPCRECTTLVQRIRYATNETNYCPRCQTGGKLLADRSLSRLLKRDWPRTIDELERLRATGKRREDRD
jgi:formamidopyrimidine-DNA glycosylase